jgi:hypothetical protein
LYRWQYAGQQSTQLCPLIRASLSAFVSVLPLTQTGDPSEIFKKSNYDGKAEKSKKTEKQKNRKNKKT